MFTNVLQYLERSAERDANHVAVTDEDGTLTYGELLAQSKQCGCALLPLNITRKPVLVFMEKNITTLSTFFGILYAGGCYVPVDPSIPQSRLANIYNTLENPLIIVNSETKATLIEALPEAQVIDSESLVDTAGNLSFETTSDSILEEKLATIRAEVTETDAAYVLFTSGSTGIPKGVEVSHGAIVTFIDDFVETFGFTSNDIFANQAPFDFDISVKDIYGALAVGATLAIVPRKLFSQPAALIEYVNAQKATVMVWAVAALCLVSSLHGLDYAGLPTVRKVLFSGEVMPMKHLAIWEERLPEAQFVNLYGPTEITCNCSYHIVNRERNYTDGLPIGIPFDHCTITLRDETGNIVTEPGVEAELCVTGKNVANGYYNNPDQTARAFKTDESGAAMYCTGDLAYYAEQTVAPNAEQVATQAVVQAMPQIAAQAAIAAPTAELYFCGRKDNQIKHLGHRIELEEIDVAFEKCEGVTRCRCVFDPEKSRLHAFFEGPAEKENVLAQAQGALPIYMIPNSLNKVEEMPLTKNGKVDRKQLLKDYLAEQQRIKEAKRAARAARAAR